MHPTPIALAFLLLAMPVLHGCSKSPGTPASETPTSAPSPATDAVASAPSREDAKACDLVTSTEMSAIIGTAVVGVEPDHHSSGKTECVYKPVQAASPYVEFAVEWGEGETAMSAMGTMGQIEPGITNPYEGIGDQAATVGTSLWIRSGEDLVTITFSGVDDAPAKAKQIFDTAKARM